MLPAIGAETHAGVKRFADYKDPLSLSCQVLVVGSGPGGAVAAKELAEQGLDVIVVEEGPPYAPPDFRPDHANEILRGFFREQGMRASRGNLFMPTLQAICLGGGSLLNSAICLRAPDWVFEQWRERTGFGLTRAALDPHYARVEDVLGIEPTRDEVQGRRNELFKKGCDALGISCEPTPRNTRGCKGSGECFSGCRNQAKMSTDLTFLPAAMRAGARVFSSIRAEQVLASGRRVHGMRGHVIEPGTWKSGHAVEVRAEAVVLAAGCFATPVILQKSGIVDDRGWTGRDLGMHPGLAIMGVFPELVEPWQGATQGFHSLHFLKEGLKFEVLWAPPSVLAARLPGLGHEFLHHLTTYERMAPFDVYVAAKHSHGSVRAQRGTFEPAVQYEFAQQDVDLILRGMGILSDIFWAAGAEAILPGLHGIPERITSRADAEIIKTKRLLARDTIAAANHAFGTTRMAKQAKDGVVDEEGRHHALDNLFITDTGIFAGSPAVNPMLTCMALSDRIAQRLAQHLKA